MNKNANKLVVDTSKDSFQTIKVQLENFNGQRIRAEAFNALSQDDKVKCLRIWAGRALMNGKKRIRCMDVNHLDEHPSMGLCEDTGGWHCFSCGLSCDVFDLIGAVFGYRDFKSQYKKAVLMFVEKGGDFIFKSKSKNGYTSKPKRTYRPKYSGLPAAMQKTLHNPHYKTLEKCEVDGKALAEIYVYEDRGIDEDIADKYHLRCWEYDFGLYVVFVNDDGSVCRRRFDEDMRYYAEGKWWNSRGTVGIFNERALQSGDVVFVCESAFDALTVIQLTGHKAIALNGLSNFYKVADRKNLKLILLLDNDNSGKNTARQWVDKYYVPDFLLEGYSGDSVLSKVKDVNDTISLLYARKHNVLYSTDARVELNKIYEEAVKFYEYR